MPDIYLTLQFDVSQLSEQERTAIFPSDLDLELISQVVNLDKTRCSLGDSASVYFVEVESGEVSDFIWNLCERVSPALIAQVVSLVNCDVNLGGRVGTKVLGQFWSQDTDSALP